MAMCAFPRTIASSCFAALLFSAPVVSQTRDFLDAPVVKSRLRVRWNSNLKAMQWAADNDGTFRIFPSSALFLTKRSIYVVYPYLNPLAIQATVSNSAVADPGYANITALLNVITGVLNTAVNGLPAGVAPPVNEAPSPSPPKACQNPAADIANLRADLDAASPANAAAKVATWPDRINTEFGSNHGGPQAVAAAVAEMTTFENDLGKQLDNAKEHWKNITSCAPPPGPLRHQTKRTSI